MRHDSIGSEQFAGYLSILSGTRRLTKQPTVGYETQQPNLLLLLQPGKLEDFLFCFGILERLKLELHGKKHEGLVET